MFVGQQMVESIGSDGEERGDVLHPPSGLQWTEPCWIHVIKIVDCGWI